MQPLKFIVLHKCWVKWYLLYCIQCKTNKKHRLANENSKKNYIWTTKRHKEWLYSNKS